MEYTELIHQRESVRNYDPAILRKALNLDDKQLVFGITPLGYPKTGYKKNNLKNRKPPEEIIKFL